MTVIEQHDTTTTTPATRTPPAARVLAEFAGTFIICLAIYATGSFGTAILGLNMAFFVLATAVAYMAVTAMLDKVCAGHFNPAVTVAAMLVSRIGILEGIASIIAQVAGAALAGGILTRLLPTSDSVSVKTWITPAVNGFDDGSAIYAYYLSNISGISFGIVAAIVVETVAAAVIVGMFMSSTTADGRPTARYAAAMGAAYGLGAAVCYPITNAALNPARATGIALFARNQGLNVEPISQLWVFWVCPLLAAAVIALVMIVAQMASGAAQARRDARDAATVFPAAGEPSETVETVETESGAGYEAAPTAETAEASASSSQTGSAQEDAQVGDEQSQPESDADEGVERD